ncbi:MAG TPA: cytochrome C oxidase subunit IV family protein [Terriglobales bacterium]|nr:cytochrome C oxidase subunit IV family protein [Terriglobales bacterium]
MAETIVSRRIYFIIFFALMVFTVITAAVSYIDLGAWSGVVAVGIASTKALLVALFFMHLRYDHQKIVWIVAISGFFWLGILFVLTATDYATRNFLTVPGR